MSDKTQYSKVKAETYSSTQPALNRALVLGVLGVTILLAGVALFFTLRGQGSAVDTNQPSIQYIVGKDAANSGVLDAPLTIKVRIPGLDGTPKTMLSGVLVQLLDESGQPAEFGGRRDVLPMRSTVDIEVWEYVGSVPSKPGVYHAQVQLLPFAKGAETRTLDLREPILKAVADTVPPVTSGFVMSRESDLWIISTDGSRERRLTFYTPSPASEFANDPAWSPSGKTLAYTYSPRPEGREAPRTEIWAMEQGSVTPKRLVAHGQDEVLYAPAWSADGKYLYFTLETSQSDGSLLYRTDMVEIATGVRSQVAVNAEMLSGTSAGGVVYLESVMAQEGPTSLSRQRIVMADASGENKRTIVSENELPALYAPRVSTDGKWLVFGAVNQGAAPTPQPSGFNLLKWLMLEPETAAAHGVPWELYIVPTSGGKPVQLTTLADDEPYPIWHTSSKLSFLGLKGLYTLSIDAQGKPVGDPQRLGEGLQHGKLTWHGP